MKSKSFFHFILFALAYLILTACSQQSGQTQAATSVPVAAIAKTNKQAEPITLRLAVSDQIGVPSESSVFEFIDQVRSLSNGSIEIKTFWGAGGEEYESGVITAVRDGQYDLGFAASRAWEKEEINFFKPLQAPMLIDNDALAVAVSTGDVAGMILDKLPGAGIVGLVIWPEDLRHPFSVVTGKTFVSPDDFADETIRVTSEGITSEIIKALGGRPVFLAGKYQGAESGLRQGFSLIGSPTATGNLVFFPKFQVLFANQDSFNQLTKEQRSILREAANETRTKTIAERPSEFESGTQWCADSGSIVLANEDQLAAFEHAFQPILEQIEQDPFNAKTIQVIRELKANTEPSVGAMPCGSAVIDQSSKANGILDGTWDFVIPEEEAKDWTSDYGIAVDEVRTRLGFNNNEWWQTAVFDGQPQVLNGTPEGELGTFRVRGNFITVTENTVRREIRLKWALVGNHLTLTVVGECDLTTTPKTCHDDRSQMDPIMLRVMEHTYTKSGDNGGY